MDAPRSIYAMITTSIISTIALIALFMGKYFGDENRDYKEDAYNYAIENNYVAYLDGNEVDITKLIVDEYRITIDNTTQEIYLTQKHALDFGTWIRVKD